MRRRTHRLVSGVGINDANYSVCVVDKSTNKIVWSCPYYVKWANMLNRCYNKRYQKVQPTYKDKYVCEEWLIFSNFRAWMEDQVWDGLELDKDILVKGNKIYSPITCAFVPRKINMVLKDGKKSLENLPIGVVKATGSENRTKPFRMQVQLFNDKNISGLEKAVAEEAHKAWQWAKAEQIEKAVAWYSEQTCFRTDVADALMSCVWLLRKQHLLGEVTNGLCS